MSRTLTSLRAFLIFVAVFTLHVSTEAQILDIAAGKRMLPNVAGLRSEKSSFCGMNSVPAPFSAVAAEYQYSRLSGTYYSLRDGLSASLMFNNKGAEPILATPTFYSLAGTRLQLAPIVVPAASYLDVDLHQLLAGSADEFREGSLKVSY